MDIEVFFPTKIKFKSNDNVLKNLKILQFSSIHFDTNNDYQNHNLKVQASSHSIKGSFILKFSSIMYN